MTDITFLKTKGDDVQLDILLSPKASKNNILGIHNNRLKVAVTAPPVDGKANAALIKFISSFFKVPKSRIILTTGEISREKSLLLLNCDKKKIAAALDYL